MLNWLMQMNVDDADDRQKENDARAYFVSHGYWPGEGPAN
jgi:ribonuclease I